MRRSSLVTALSLSFGLLPGTAANADRAGSFDRAFVRLPVNRNSRMQRLNAALFVDIQDDRISRRIHVQPDNIRERINEVRVRSELKVLNTMRLQVMRAPQPINCTAAHAKPS